MNTFDKCYRRLRITEGGFANHPADRGGMTFCGISRVHHPEWPGWAMVDGYLGRGMRPDMLVEREFLLAMVKNFYHGEYWIRLKLCHLPPRIAAEVFDSAVNCGRTTATRWLQRAMNQLAADPPILKEDGTIGPRTIGKVNARVANYGDEDLLLAMNQLQYDHYRNLVEKDPSQQVFFDGWLKRTQEDHDYAV